MYIIAKIYLLLLCLNIFIDSSVLSISSFYQRKKNVNGSILLMIHPRADATFLSKLLKPFHKRSKHKKHPHPTFQQLSKENLKVGRKKKEEAP